ncbi:MULTISPECIES: hypothetical protein [Rhodococcus]|uniref:hypothetical protein n=1 Tax=Rhodococcus TaxID=1827 RepID=UPI000C7C679D|nr:MULTISPECIES: hypothetical protein [Rhodococcus]AUM18277.1 hypothetical protein CSW53_18150 [Rhodococcus ruber]
MSIRNELIEVAHSVICETNLDDCIEWHGRCAKATDAVLDRFAVVELPTGPTGITYTTEDHEPFPPEALERMAGELLHQARMARKESK